MRIVDHYVELWPPVFGAPRGNIKDFTAATPWPDEQQLVDYVRVGHEVVSIMGSSEDVLGSGKSILGGDSLFSDGTWVWRGDLWFYLRSYHLRVPEEFREAVRSNDYAMPEPQDGRLLEIAELLMDHL